MHAPQGYRVTHSVRDGRKCGGVNLIYKGSFTVTYLLLLNVKIDIFEPVGSYLSIRGEK